MWLGTKPIGLLSLAHITCQQVSSQSMQPILIVVLCSVPKMDCLHALVSIHKPDTICIWLCPDITAAEISRPGYSAVRLDRDRHTLSSLWLTSTMFSVHNLHGAGHPSAPNSTWLVNRVLFFCVSVQCAQLELSLAVLY